MQLPGPLRWLRHAREDAQLAEELEEHRALIQADFESQGMSAAEASAASRRAMGNMTLAREDAREVWVWAWLDRLWRDARYAARTMRNEPTFSLTATLTLALGIGLTTAVFSIADAELWKPLPYPDPEQLVAISSRAPGEHTSTDGISGADLLDWREGTEAFSQLAVDGSPQRQVLQLQRAESVIVLEVTANYFATLGRKAVIGRTFDDSDANRPRVAVLTDRAWQRLFGGDPAVVGRSVILDGDAVTIVGVVPAENSLGLEPEAFVAYDEASPAFRDRSNPIGYGVIGRLRPGIRSEQAREQLQAVASRLAAAHRTGRADHRIEIEDLRNSFSGYNWRPLYFLVGASIVVLVLSALNVAALLVARAMRRRREFALRGALGGGRAALAAQLTVEGAFVALPAGALGILFASWLLAVLVPALPADFLARGAQIPLDVRVGAYALAATSLATILFALLPLPLARRLNGSATLRDGGRSGPAIADGRARSVLLGMQIGLTVILLAGAAIFLKSFAALTRVPLGFDPMNVSALHIVLSGPRYESGDTVRQYAERLLDNARAVPGVSDVTVASSSPLGSGPLTFFVRPDRPRPAAGEETRVILRSVGEAYFRTLRIPMLQGRNFSAADVAGAPRVAIVNATLVRKMFGDETDVIGRVIELLPSRAPWTRQPGALQIVGIAANAKEAGINEVEIASAYVPFAQMPATRFELIARADTPAAGIDPTLRDAAARTDPATPVLRVTSFEQRVDGALQGDRFNALLVGGFALIAIVLSAIGVYGVSAYDVQARTREFGIRLALGARPASLVGATLLRGSRVAGIGAALGIAATLFIARVLGTSLYLVPGAHEGLLYGVSTTDPAMLALAFAGVLIVSVASAGVPARRVTSVDPARTLRID